MINKLLIFIILMVSLFLLVGCEETVVITDIPDTTKYFQPIHASIYSDTNKTQVKPINLFLQVQTSNIKHDIHLTKHNLGQYVFYGKTNKFTLWDTEIGFTGKWFEDGVLMPYGLFTPTYYCEYDKLPLIVYLHGSGSKTKTAEHFMTHGVQKLFTEWPYEGVRTYIVVPQLARGFNSGSWKNKTAKEDLQQLLDYLLENYNIDKERIYIMGHSLGGQGAMYMSHEMPEYFAACVSLSPYSPSVEMKDVTIPFRAYLGTVDGGEDERCVKYAVRLEKIFGEDSVFYFHCTHGQVPLKTFALDEDKNKRPDVLEWLFIQHKT